MKVAIWRLADDPESYGADAGKFILTTPDGEEEVTYTPGKKAIFATEEEARGFAEAHGDDVVPLEFRS